MENSSLYPLKFESILKQKVWGGDKLHKVLGKPSKGRIGESWEVSGVPGSISKVKDGPLKGMDLNALLKTYGPKLVGDRVFQSFGNEFPLLFKFIDAREDLSVQLHPNDELASLRHNSFGKTEMWYVIANDPKARLILGFNTEMDEATYTTYLDGGRITEILHSEKIQPGDAFYIAPGTIHAIGGGTLLAEIQQTSDITYRIYDWDRPDTDGTFRELHTELALKAINFNRTSPKLLYKNAPNQRVQLCRSPYFETNKLVLTEPFNLADHNLDTFKVYMCLEGEVRIESEFDTDLIVKGETVLVPACLTNMILNTNSATLLEVYIP